MKINPFFLLLFAFCTTVFTSCKNEQPEPAGDGDTNNLTLEFDNRVGAQKLVLGTTPYKNDFGEEFSVTTLNYFISNVSLKKTDGTVVKFPDQYFLIRQVDSNTWEPELKNVPAGDYSEVSFMVGVDSLKSASPIAGRTGVLDTYAYGEDNMWWGWNSGYIFFKFEGTSPVVPANGAGLRPFQYHVGGYGGYTNRAPNNIRTVTLPLNGTATVRKSISPTIHFVVNLQKFFNSTTALKLQETKSVHDPSVAAPLANNYVKMFTVDHIHND